MQRGRRRTGLALLVQMLTHPGDGVVVQGPYYGSFAKIITLNGRKLLENPLASRRTTATRWIFANWKGCFAMSALR